MLNTTILDKYLISEQVNENDLLVVYRGKDTQTNQAVIATAVKPKKVAAGDFLARFDPLRKLISKVDSPHTVKVVESSEVEGQAVVVQEGIEGKTLAAMIAGGNGLPLDLALDIALQLGEYLDALHKCGIIQDVFDPENILLSAESEIRVLNLGLAQGLNIGELLSKGKLKAAACHAPELLRGEQGDVRTDFYSLGAILFQALTGKEPGAPAAVEQSLIEDFYPSRFRIGISPEWDELVAKCLHPNPAKRIQSAAEFLNKVEEIRRGMEVGTKDTILGMEDSLVGQTLGAYRLVERLGQGGMATVYKAYEAALDRYVAVKVLPQFFASDPNFAQRFRREAKAVAQLNHPNIVPIYSYGEESGITYIAMQFVEGGTLKHERGQVYSSEEALRLLLPIARALGYAHARGIVHRDIKPSNVLLAEGDWPVLADFGLAQMAEASGRLTGTGVGVGTPMYMSPEQGQGTKVDHRTDIYSLGIMLYELVTGDVPFRADTPMAIVIKHLTAPMPMPRQVNPDIPEDVETVILKATAKSPDDRYQKAEDMATAMERSLNQLSAAKPAEVVEEARPKRAKLALAPAEKFLAAKRILKTALAALGGIVGLCLLGVILMGVFDICPPVGPWPQPPWCEGSPYKLPTFGGGAATSVPAPMITEGALGSILFQDDFEGQISNRWAFTSGPGMVPWEAIVYDGRTVMHSLPANPPGDSSTAEIKPTTWDNYAVQFDFRFLKPDQFGDYYFELQGQFTDCPPTIQSTQSYMAVISADMLRLSKNFCRQGGSSQLSESDKNIDPEMWHTLQYVFIGNRIQVLIDGENYIDYTDNNEPFTTGGDLWITTYGESEILIDNLKVYEIIPTGQAPSTESSQSLATQSTGETNTEAAQAVQQYTLPDFVSTVLSGAEVLFVDDFSKISSNTWNYQEDLARSSDGKLEIQGQSPFASQIQWSQPLHESRAVLLLMTFEPATEYIVGIQSGEWQTASFKQLAINKDWLLYMREGIDIEKGFEDNSGVLAPQARRWYYVLMALDSNAEFRVYIWDRDDPSKYSEFDYRPIPGWSGLDWTFFVGVNSGTVMLDDFAEISFTVRLVCEAGMTEKLYENFEDQRVDAGWSFRNELLNPSEAWPIVDDGSGNHVWVGSNDARAAWTGSPPYNYVVFFRMRMREIDSELYSIFRNKQYPDETYGYYFSTESGLLSKEPPGTNLARADQVIKDLIWHDLVISASGDQITISMDGANVLQVVDEDPFTQGWIEFQSRRGQIWYDNILICSLPGQ